MLAVFKREFGAYFSSPIGYVFIAVYLFFSGAFFYIFALSMGSTDLSYVFLGMFFVLMIFIPVLTMRLMSEDNKQKTDQLTLTAPISLFRLVMGKFLSAFSIFLISTSVLVVYAIVLSFFSEIAWAMVWGNVVGIILLGAVFIAAGLFISTLTENQMIAAVGSMAVNVALLLMDSLASVIPIKFISDILSSISVFSRFSEITTGIFSLSNVLFFVSVIVIFLFLTVRVLEKRRWS
ncbi:MAG: ABC transporter permease [Ruminiclostridium sp.]